MAKWEIELCDLAIYEIEAESEDEALDVALEYWEQRSPRRKVTKMTEPKMLRERGE